MKIKSIVKKSETLLFFNCVVCGGCNEQTCLRVLRPPPVGVNGQVRKKRVFFTSEIVKSRK